MGIARSGSAHLRLAPMHYLSGAFLDGLPFMASYGGQGRRLVKLETMVWAADNGCYARPKSYTNEGYLAWLDQCPRNALFAAAPDVVGDWSATLERAKPMLDQVRTLGFKAALVLQDGATIASVPWDECDAVFVGGSTKWKLSAGAEMIVREARRLDKWAHMGRVNSWIRLRVAAAIGCQSSDGNLAAYGRDRWAPMIAAWPERLRQQPMLALNP